MNGLINDRSYINSNVDNNIQKLFANSTVDYGAYYFASKTLFSDDFLRVYEADETNCYICKKFNVFPYRYLPSFLFYIYPLTFFDFATSYLIFNFISWILNVLTIYIFFRLAKTFSADFKEKNMKFYMGLFFIAYFQVAGYIMGQVGSLIGFVLTLSLYCFITKRELIGGLLIGISMSIKPVSFILILFTLIFSKNLRSFFKRLLGISLPLMFDLVLFLIFPKILSDFIYINLKFFELSTSYFNNLFLSLSFTNFLYNYVGINPSYAMFALIAVFIPIIIFVKKRYKLENNFIFIFSTAMCLYFVSQRMSWSNQIHYLLPFLMLAKLATGENLKKTFFFYLIYLILLIPYDMGYFFNENITFVMVPVIGIYTLLIMIDLLYSYKNEKTNFT